MDYENKTDQYYDNYRPEMLAFLPTDVSKILDVGCSNGGFGKSIKENRDVEIWGIEPMNDPATKARSVLDKVIENNIESAIKELPSNYFDVIYFNDVLEHLLDPYFVLETIKDKLKDGGVVISSIPNIRYFRNFFKLLFNKDFEYTLEGVMDKTHLRFFTTNSIKNMYSNAGYSIIKHQGINGSKSLKPKLFNILFGFKASDVRYSQFATVAKKK